MTDCDPTTQVRDRGCDYPGHPPVYLDGSGGYTCRCLVCGRCGHHTGNTNQGHYWAFCKVTKTLREHHYCCPGNCSLTENT